MKKIIFLTALSFLVACTTQKRVVINGKKSYAIPHESEQISSVQALSRFPDLGDKFIAREDVHLYAMDNMLVGLGLRTASPDADFSKPFEYYKNQLTSVLNKDDNYKVNDISLKTYNNQQFMIIDYGDDKDNFIRFRSFQKGSYSMYNGFIRYAKDASKEKAFQALDKILNSIKIGQ